MTHKESSFTGTVSAATLYSTHTAHSGNGNGTGDETETFVHTDIKISCPRRENRKISQQSETDFYLHIYM